jgi:hypothetical protein
MLFVGPAGAGPELYPAIAHRIDSGDGYRERAWMPERGGRHERGEPDP